MWDSPMKSAEPHEGFYTQEQIKEIIQYVEEKYIPIVPKTEMHGHSAVTIASYPWLGTSKKVFEVPIKFGVGKDVYDKAKPKVTKFLKDVLDEIIQVFTIF